MSRSKSGFRLASNLLNVPRVDEPAPNKPVDDGPGKLRRFALQSPCRSSVALGELRIEKETDFWGHLEFRVCRELEGLEKCRQQGLWCDGFIPEMYVLNAPSPYISGHVWIGIGPGKQEKWAFTLFLGKGVSNRKEIEWSKLLPLENITQWLLVDLDSKRLEIEPDAGIQDDT